MSKMIRRSKSFPRSVIPFCANVYNYGPSGGSGGGPGSFSLSRLVPASDVGFSSSGNTIGVLNTSFVPSRIDNPARVLFGLSNIPNVVDPSQVPVDLTLSFSTSNPVDLVTRVVPKTGSNVGNYRAGTSGFYFRNEVPSDFYYMIGSTSGESEFGRRLVIVAVPSSKDVTSSTISEVPGFVARFTTEVSYIDKNASVANCNTAFRCNFIIAQPLAIGTLIPITETLNIRLGSAVIRSYTSDLNSLGITSDFDSIDYVCFS